MKNLKQEYDGSSQYQKEVSNWSFSLESMHFYVYQNQKNEERTRDYHIRTRDYHIKLIKEELVLHEIMKSVTIKLKTRKQSKDLLCLS